MGAWLTRIAPTLATRLPSLTQAGNWLHKVLWGSKFAKATTVVAAGSMLMPKSQAGRSAAAGQVAQFRGV